MNDRNKGISNPNDPHRRDGGVAISGGVRSVANPERQVHHAKRDWENIKTKMAEVRDNPQSDGINGDT